MVQSGRTSNARVRVQLRNVLSKAHGNRFCGVSLSQRCSRAGGRFSAGANADRTAVIRIETGSLAVSTDAGVPLVGDVAVPEVSFFWVVRAQRSIASSARSEHRGFAAMTIRSV